MVRQCLVTLTLIIITLSACQPVRPEAELTPVAPAGPTTPAATAITGTVITGTGAITEATPISNTDAISPGQALTATNTVSTSASGGTARDRTARDGTPPSSTPRNLDPEVPLAPPASGGTTACPAITNPAQTLDLTIRAVWEVDEMRQYLASQSRVDINGAVEAVSLASTTPFTVTVAEANDDGYILEWHYGQATLGETDLPIPDPLASLFQSPLQVTFEYATDADGIYLGLLNVEALRAQLVPLFDQLFEAIAASDEEITPEIIEAARGVVERMIDDPSNFEALFTGDTQLLHTLYGITFDDAMPVVVDDVRPNMLGGAPIPSELTITPTHYDAELGCLHVMLENVADPVAARDSILEALQIQAREMGMPGPTDDDLPAELDLVDTIHIEYDLTNGWATAVYMERAIAIGDQGRVESGELIFVEPGME